MLHTDMQEFPSNNGSIYKIKYPNFMQVLFDNHFFVKGPIISVF